MTPQELATKLKTGDADYWHSIPPKDIYNARRLLNDLDQVRACWLSTAISIVKGGF